MRPKKHETTRSGDLFRARFFALGRLMHLCNLYCIKFPRILTYFCEDTYGCMLFSYLTPRCPRRYCFAIHLLFQVT
jgi:hypothetical protein